MMGISLSIGGLLGNADKGLPLDMPGMDVEEAAHQTALRCSGGVATLADRMGVNAGTLQNKLNPNKSTHHLTLRESVLLQRAANDHQVLHAMAQQLGHACYRVMGHQDGGDPVEAFMHYQRAAGNFTCANADALHGKPDSSRNELRRVQEAAAELIEKIGAMVAAIDARVPQRPPQG